MDEHSTEVLAPLLMDYPLPVELDSEVSAVPTSST